MLIFIVLCNIIENVLFRWKCNWLLIVLLSIILLGKDKRATNKRKYESGYAKHHTFKAVFIWMDNKKEFLFSEEKFLFVYQNKIGEEKILCCTNVFVMLQKNNFFAFGIDNALLLRYNFTCIRLSSGR